MTITKQDSFNLICIYINNILHLSFILRELIGIQTWKLDGIYSIELTFRGGATITIEYDEINKWKKVIKLIEESLCGKKCIN